MSGVCFRLGEPNDAHRCLLHLIEALLLALLGAAIGIGISYAVFDGSVISTLGGALSGSQLAFSLSITPMLTIRVALLACALGLAGGLVPAIRAARSNIADALYETWLRESPVLKMGEMKHLDTRVCIAPMRQKELKLHRRVSVAPMMDDVESSRFSSLRFA